MKFRLTGKGLAMLAAAAGAAVSIAAQAQQSRGVLIDENGNRVREAPAAPRAVHSQTITESRTDCTFHDGNNTVKAKVEDGVATVTLNGEVVMTKPMSEEWESYDVKGPNGAVIATVERFGDQLGISNGGRGGFGRAMSGLSPLQAEIRAYGMATSEPPAKVMMGITMGVPSAETAEQLGIDRETTTLVTTVREGLPAAAAGLKAYDVIVKVDGQTPATQELIRKVLREKNAGDELKFEVLRRGEAKDVVIKLEAYDPQRLGEASWNVYGGHGGTAIAPTPFFELRHSLGARGEELEKKLTELAERMSEKSSRLAATAGAEAQELGSELATLASQVAEMAKELAEELNEQGPAIREGMLALQGQLGNEVRRMIIAPPAPVTPAPPGSPSGVFGFSAREAELQAQNEAYRAQIEAMRAEQAVQQKSVEERMAKMEEMMQKLVESQAKKP